VLSRKGSFEFRALNAAADCILRAQKSAFDYAAVGKPNLMAAVLRGEVEVRSIPGCSSSSRTFPRPLRESRDER
jgi:hypothetical protein